MREKVVGNAVCQVRTSRACCNPCDCQKEREVERGEPQLGMNIKTLAWQSAVIVLEDVLDVLFYFSYSSEA